MIEDYEKNKRKQVTLMRSVMDYSMGVIFLVVGIVFLLKNKLNLNFNEFFTPLQIKILGYLFILYGVWRIYKGYKKKYFR